MSANDTVLVLTYKSVETMIEEGGCGHWKANAQSLTSCRYVVATRNERRTGREGDEPHGAAFMVGEVSGVSQEQNGPRFVIQMRRFARLSTPSEGAWQAGGTGGSNPVRYARFRDLGISLKNLKWEPWPGQVAEYVDQPLTMAQAKAGLALTFGVAPEQIKITIEG
ncbi:hypothetical protein M0D68_06815 [Paraburkholderia sp. SEWSISQ10-3 4]|uniref:hypothetical protein n=1 Tax=Paraburkholderia TaxID=1822464 RepID=UPI00225022F3|nr:MULTISPECIES: hypothetical protein [Paraburkholderia]MCX4137888.1 hypothetical protein [Paraburkholderia aspalathi]MDN7170579.1 hypothetical protein [Paraburkholderia sp. SEWSISQ10-3 4]MDQ6500218.1 hypothetical protein [Paraburkholderia aspalathi]